MNAKSARLWAVVMLWSVSACLGSEAVPEELSATASGEPLTLEASAYYRVISRNSGKCAEVAGSSTADGGNIRQWTCNGGAHQQWQFQGVGGGFFRMINRQSGKDASVWGDSSADGADIVQWGYHDATSQQWQLVDLGGDLVRITARHSGKVFDVAGISSADGADIYQWSYVGQSNQQWQLVKEGATQPPPSTPPPASAPIAGQRYTLVARHSNKCAEVYNALPSDGGNIQQWSCYGGAHQQWTFSAVSGGYYRIVNVGSGRDFSVWGDSTADGANIVQWGYHNVPSQEWQLSDVGGGYFRISARHSGKAVDVAGVSSADGANIQQWGYGGGANQQWRLEPASSNPPPTTPPPTTPPPTGPFGNTTIHPERLGVYMIPDLPPQYTNWGLTETSLRKFRSLLPNAWIRWDNETGHYTDTPANVEAFVQRANAAGVPMIITASAVDGYNNWWANGNRQPTVSIRQIADGPYLAFADRLRRGYANVRFIETINEPDTIWFVADPDDVNSWNHYMSRLYAATSNDYAHILGPSVAFKGSNIWNNHLARGELGNFSYHTYGGWSALQDVGNKQVYVTEYGFDSVSQTVGDSPGYILQDLWNAERNARLSGNVRMIFYVNLQRMMRADALEGNHFAFSGQLRALALYQALGNVAGNRAHLNAAQNDFMGAANGTGGFAALLWNGAESWKQNQTRTVPGTGLTSTANLQVLTVFNTVTGAADCRSIGAQSRVSASVSNGTVSVTIQSLEPLAAVLVSTAPCTELAN